MMQIYNFHLVWLFLIFPIIGVLFSLSARRRRTRYSSYADQHIISHHLQRVSRFNTWMKVLLITIAIGFTILGLLRPQWDHEQSEITNQGLDIILAIDVSRSMDATDLAPSRLERGKLQVHNLIDGLQGDRIGIIAFAGTATLECPLTNDYDAARLVINSLTSQSAVRSGSNLGRAFTMAEKAFNVASGSNILIMISDGEDLAGQGLAMASRLTSQGVRIFTMGAGTSEGAVVYHPRLNEEAYTRADHAFLQRLASVGQGSYYNLGSDDASGDRILAELREGGEGRLQGRRITGLKEQYHGFVILAILALLIESLIIPLRREPKSQ